jgi:hypothetical protein
MRMRYFRMRNAPDIAYVCAPDPDPPSRPTAKKQYQNQYAVA